MSSTDRKICHIVIFALLIPTVVIYLYTDKSCQFCVPPFYSDSTNENIKKSILLNSISVVNDRITYSRWPKFEILNLNTQHDGENERCMNLKNKTFSNLKQILIEWKSNANNYCQDTYNKFILIYKIRFKELNITFPEMVYQRIKNKLGDNNPFREATNRQVLII